MLPMNRLLAVFIGVVGLQVFVVGAVTAAQISGGEVEALETILSYFALLFLGIFGSCIGFARWFLKRWDPKNLDPVTVMMVEKIMKETGAGPLIERVEAIEEREQRIIELLTKFDAELHGDQGRGEHYLKHGR